MVNQDHDLHDRCDLAHQWAMRAVMSLESLARSLQRGWENDDIGRQTIAGIINSFLSPEIEDCPAFNSFADERHPRVEVFGDEFQSHHDAAKKILAGVYYTIELYLSSANEWSLAVLDAQKIGIEHETAVAEAFCNALSGHRDVGLADALDGLALLKVECSNEYASIRAMTSDRKRMEEPAEPQWDEERRELLFRGKVVKAFRQPAKNQIAILEAFQTEGWPPRIDDPLPHTPAADPTGQRLRDAVHSLNTGSPIVFELDGTGRILWKPKPL